MRIEVLKYEYREECSDRMSLRRFFQIFSQSIIAIVLLWPVQLLGQNVPMPVNRADVPALPEVMAHIPELSIFSEAIEKAELRGFLQGTGPFTILALSNSYFETLDDVSRTLLFSDKKQLTEMVKAWTMQGRLPLSDLFKLRRLPVLTGAMRGTILGPMEGIDNYSISRSDIVARNGIIHILNVFPHATMAEGVFSNAE